MDIQLATNLRAIPLFYRETLDMLKAAGAEHRNALVDQHRVDRRQAGRGVAERLLGDEVRRRRLHAVDEPELNGLGIKSTALCPAFVDTAMTDFVKEQVAPEAMIQTSDIVAAVRMLLALSPGCVVPEIVFQLPGGGQLDDVR